MFNRTCLLIPIVLAWSVCALGQVEPPTLTPIPATGKQTVLIQEAIAQHDRGNYDAAIKMYEEVLAENPDSVEALYELAFTYSKKKDPRKSLEIAYKGARYKSKMLAGFYMQIGNNLDELGEAGKAVDVYKAAIKLLPNMSKLHFNLAVTYRNMGKLEDATRSVKQSIILDPDYPGGHAVLSGLWDEGRYKTPALLAACRFLVLEPTTARSNVMLKQVRELMGRGVKAGADTSSINVLMDSRTKKDEGDFDAIDLAMSLGKAASLMEKNKEKTPMQLLVGQFETFFAILSEQSDKADKTKFTWNFYAPYFAEMKRKNFVEPFVYYISQSDGNEETLKWLKGHETQVGNFVAWSGLYKWPEADK